MIKTANHYFHHRPHLRLLLIIIGVILIALFALRIYAYVKLRNETNQLAILNVLTVTAEPAGDGEEIVLPGNVLAWHEATIFARTNGYIKAWYVDIGSRVKAGDLLAEIEAPEVNAQLRQTEENLKTSEAESQLANITAKRWIGLLKTDSVSKQDTDEKISSAKALLATVGAMKASRDRLRDLVSFQRVIAPFDGIITSRTTDIGSLINAGSNTVPALFHIVQANPLRIYVRVPQNDAGRIQPNLQATLRFNDHPGKSFSAKLFNTAKAIDPVTRTLLIQLVAENKNNEIFPGGYTQVHLKMPVPDGRVRLPVNTLLFRSDGLLVATIDDHHKVKLLPIKIYRDLGNEIELSAGVKPGQAIILNPPDSIFAGQEVRVSQNAKSDGFQ